MWRRIFIFIVYFVPNLVIADVRSNVFFNEVQSLSELPMEKLIHLKSTFFDQRETPESREALGSDFNQSSMTLPIALPLRRPDFKPLRRYDDNWQDEKKGSKISKVFQLAITALSFFAFGGYLLTLIITAIRRNAATASAGNVIFLQGLQSVKRPKRGVLVFHDSMANDFDTERLYRGMIMLSEGYALYN